MNLRWSTRLVLALVSGLLLALAFPKFHFTVLAWIALVPLFVASFRARRMEAALYGFLHGGVFFLLSVPWMDTVMREYGNVPALAAAGILGLVIFICSLFTAAFAILVAHWSQADEARACVLAPFLWVALEFGRTHMPIIGFPWNLTGYAVSGNLALVQVTTWTGIYGLSFLVVGFNAMVAWLVVRPTLRARLAMFAAALVVFLVAVFGPYLVPHAPADHVAHLVHTQIPQSTSFPADWTQRHAADLREMEEASVSAAQSKPGLIVWPEVPAPFSLRDPEFAARAERIAREANGEFLVGVDDWQVDREGKWSVSNSAALLDAAGRRIFTYDKIRLVPFGEYVPLRRSLTFAGKLTAEIGDFTPGKEYRVGQLPGGTFGVVICYEAIFPNEVRQFTSRGAELLINISNDGWFGHSAAPAQHVMMARVRAVENRRWLLRATNTGYTVDVDPYGRIVAEYHADSLGVLEAPYGFRSDRTLYVRWGDWWCWLCLLVTLAAIVNPNRKRERGPQAA
jgi:apolipoprotein N-acyltransferase